MYRYQILIEYVGTPFIGWQVQKKGKSVQKIIQLTLSKLLKQKIILFSAGRTDREVHANGQSAHFDVENKIQNIDKMIKSLNFFLNPKKISIINIIKRNKNFHARYSAKERVYKYFIINRLATPVIENERAWHIRKKLDVKLLKEGAKKLRGTHDFSTMRATNCYAKSPIKKINKITIKNTNSRIEIEFRSKSFLRNQVRSMVGCLKYLAEKKWNIKKFENVLKSKKRKNCAPPAPAHGLYLDKIIY
jgi:tRNA pseudouridine38-40 synthase